MHPTPPPMRLRYLPFAAATLLAAACNPGMSGTITARLPDMANDPNRDSDGDNFTPKLGDCDDLDPDSYPGAKEKCGDFIDQNCDGLRDEDCDNDKDGYTVKQGDCLDNEALIGPGAFEILTKKEDDGREVPEGLDNNCDGRVDEPPLSCDAKITTDDPKSFAAVAEICPPWLLEAGFNAGSDSLGRQMLAKYGRNLKPRQGGYFAALATGLAIEQDDPRFVDPQPGTEFKNKDPHPAPGMNKNKCTGGMTPDPPEIYDAQILTLKLKVPQNAGSFTFQFNFFSSEYPEFVGNQYNDKFMVVLDSKMVKGNIAFDRNNDPITINGGLFSVCDSSPICPSPPNPMWLGFSCVTDTRDPPMGKGPGDLDGTGYQLENVKSPGERIGGATGWLTATSPVTPGETITLKFLVYDAGDRLWDSLVLIDNFKWQVGSATIGVSPG